MIAAFKRRLLRLIVQREINGLEADLQDIAEQRANDDLAKKYINQQLAKSRRRLHALVHADHIDAHKREEKGVV